MHESNAPKYDFITMIVSGEWLGEIRHSIFRPVLSPGISSSRSSMFERGSGQTSLNRVVRYGRSS